MTGRVFAVTTYHKSGEKSSEAAEEWKRLGICAIGWSYVQNLCRCESKEEVTERLRKSGGKYGAKDIWNFVGKMSDGDLVLAYSRNNTIAYIGEVKGPCKLDRSNVIGDLDGGFGYAYQRKVGWWDEPHLLTDATCLSILRINLGRRALQSQKSTWVQRALTSS